MNSERSESVFHLYCFLAILFWSTIELAGKLLGSGASPYTVTAWRFLIGGMVILPFALARLKRDQRTVAPRDLLMMVLLGVLNVCVSMLFLQFSIFFGKASVSAVLVSSNPLFVSLFAFLLIDERLNRWQILGLVVAVAGIALLIFGEGDLSGARYPKLALSIACGLVASLTFGLYTVLTKKSVQKHGNTLTNSVSFLGGSLALFSYNALAGKPLLLDPSWKNTGIMLYLGIVVSGISYLLFFEGMKGIGANRSSMYFFLKPVLASLLAVLLLSEILSGWQILAIAVIIAGLTLSRVLSR
jgi:drug/metabolite transporter (DMT)-like permease